MIRLSDPALRLVAARFRVLGDPLRIRILQTLQRGELSVSGIVAEVGSTQPNVSKHLRVLHEAGIIARRQDGNTVYCSIADRTVFDLCDVVCASIRRRLSHDAKLATELRRR